LPSIPPGLPPRLKPTTSRDKLGSEPSAASLLDTPANPSPWLPWWPACLGASLPGVGWCGSAVPWWPPETSDGNGCRLDRAGRRTCAGCSDGPRARLSVCGTSPGMQSKRPGDRAGACRPGVPCTMFGLQDQTAQVPREGDGKGCRTLWWPIRAKLPWRPGRGLLDQRLTTRGDGMCRMSAPWWPIRPSPSDTGQRTQGTIIRPTGAQTTAPSRDRAGPCHSHRKRVSELEMPDRNRTDAFCAEKL
jgi:hypothetical protein